MHVERRQEHARFDPREAQRPSVRQECRTFAREHGLGLRDITEGIGTHVAIEEGRGTLGRLVKEDGLYDDIAATAENLKEITARLNEGPATRPHQRL